MCNILKSLQFMKQQHECWYLSLTSCKIWTYVQKELIKNKLYLNCNIILERKSVIDTNDNCQIMRPLKAVRMSVNPFDSAPGPIKVNPSNKHMVQRALDGWSVPKTYKVFWFPKYLTLLSCHHPHCHVGKVKSLLSSSSSSSSSDLSLSSTQYNPW